MGDGSTDNRRSVRHSWGSLQQRLSAGKHARLNSRQAVYPGQLRYCRKRICTSSL